VTPRCSLYRPSKHQIGRLRPNLRQNKAQKSLRSAVAVVYYCRLYDMCLYDYMMTICNGCHQHTVSRHFWVNRSHLDSWNARWPNCALVEMQKKLPVTETVSFMRACQPAQGTDGDKTSLLISLIPKPQVSFTLISLILMLCMYVYIPSIIWTMQILPVF